MSFFGGSKGRVIQAPLYNPQQQGALQQLLSQGMQNADFGNIEGRARSMFQTSTVPSLAERFTNMGQGAQRSSAFAGMLGQSGADLESQLAQLRSEYGMQQTQMGLRPWHENIYQQGQPGFLHTLLQSLMNGGSQVAGMAAKGAMLGM
jgi:hypothetical protein